MNSNFKWSAIALSVICSATPSFGQSTIVGNSRPGTGTNVLGWTGGTAGSLEIRNDFSGQPITFFINGGPEATIDGSGNVGIGTTAPTERLHVVGIINASGTGAEYKIGGVRALFLIPGESNLYAGEEAGIDAANTGNTGNTFLGRAAGKANTTGDQNTFVGYQAGLANTTGERNMFLGTGTGQVNTQGSQNVFIGQTAGNDNITGDDNVYIGQFAGAKSTTGDKNTCIGRQTGLYNITGDANTFLGYFATSSGSLSNSTAIGAHATVTADNCLVLGSINGLNGAAASTNVGIGTTNPTNRLEIDEGTPDKSGLTFTQLAGSSGSGANTTGMVLTVASDGEVILVDEPSGGSGSGDVVACGSPTTNRLTKWDPASSKIICNSIIRDDGNRIGVGVNPSLSVKMEVQNNTNYRVGAFVSTTTSGSPFSPLMNSGVYGNARNAYQLNVGTRGVAMHTSSVVNGPFTSNNDYISGNVGIMGQADMSSYNYGGLFIAGTSCSTSFRNYGIYASAYGQIEHGKCAPGTAGWFNGRAFASGGFFGPSDIVFKDSIQNVSGALSILSQIQPKNFVFKEDYAPYISLPVGRHYGFIAQQIDTILPNLVATFIQPEVVDSTGDTTFSALDFKAINYTGLIPLTVAAIQEQQAIINELNNDAVKSGESYENYIPKWSGTTNELNTTNIYYGDDGKVGINTDVPVAQFDVQFAEDSIAVNAVASKVGIFGLADHTLGGYGYDTIYGVLGEAIEGILLSAGVGGRSINESSSGAVNAGVYGTSANSNWGNYGVLGVVNFDDPNALHIGVYGQAESGGETFGGKFEALAGYGYNYGVYAAADNGYAAFFEGDIAHTGDIHYASDGMLKSNVHDVTDALSVILSLEPKSYEYKTNDFPQLNLPTGMHYGLIAQQVDSVLPAIVKDMTSPAVRDSLAKVVSPKMEFKGINYTALIPLLISGMKEQQAIIDSLSKELETRIANIESRLSNCCGSESAMRTSNPEEETVHQLTVELNSVQVVVLEQNVPNPFADQTSISYFVPDDAGKAQMQFTDLSGRMIKSVDLEKGSGIVTVFASNLRDGTYSYSLVIDGKLMETKKMVKTR